MQAKLTVFSSLLNNLIPTRRFFQMEGGIHSKNNFIQTQLQQKSDPFGDIDFPFMIGSLSRKTRAAAFEFLWYGEEG